MGKTIPGLPVNAMIMLEINKKSYIDRGGKGKQTMVNESNND